MPCCGGRKDLLLFCQAVLRRIHRLRIHFCRRRGLAESSPLGGLVVAMTLFKLGALVRW